MKTPITHSKPDAQGWYSIRAGVTPLGSARRTKDGRFQFIPCFGRIVGSEPILRTMAELKKQLAGGFNQAEQDQIDAENKRPDLPTVDEARRQAGLSHNDVRHLLEEIHLFHPEMARAHYGSYLMRRTFENIRDHEGLAPRFPWALRWLEQNPTAGRYKPVRPEEWEAQARLS